MKNLCGVYENIYVEHHSNGSKQYKLSTSAKESFKAGTEEKKMSSQSGSNASSDSKCNKNVLRIALVLHVLWHRIGMALQMKVDTTPATISDATMNMALVLHESLSTFSGLAEAVCAFIVFSSYSDCQFIFAIFIFTNFYWVSVKIFIDVVSLFFFFEKFLCINEIKNLCNNISVVSNSMFLILVPAFWLSNRSVRSSVINLVSYWHYELFAGLLLLPGFTHVMPVTNDLL